MRDRLVQMVIVLALHIKRGYTSESPKKESIGGDGEKGAAYSE